MMKHKHHLRSSDDEASTRLQVVNGVVIQVNARHHRFNHLLLQGIAHFIQANVFIVLHRDDYGVHAHWQHGTVVLPILHSHLTAKRINVTIQTVYQTKLTWSL